MLTVDCRDVKEIKEELLVYVSDNVVAMPTIKINEFMLSSIDDTPIDKEIVINSIKEFLDSINHKKDFAIISNNDTIAIKSITGKKIIRDKPPTPEMFSCVHCGYVTRYEVDYNNHIKIHYF